MRAVPILMTMRAAQDLADAAGARAAIRARMVLAGVMLGVWSVCSCGAYFASAQGQPLLSLLFMGIGCLVPLGVFIYSTYALPMPPTTGMLFEEFEAMREAGVPEPVLRAALVDGVGVRELGAAMAMDQADALFERLRPGAK